MIDVTSTVRIGKNGITSGLVEEIKKQLKKKKKVKVKMLGSFVKGKNRKEIADEVALKTNSKLINMAGFVFVLKKGK